MSIFCRIRSTLVKEKKMITQHLYLSKEMSSVSQTSCLRHVRFLKAVAWRDVVGL